MTHASQVRPLVHCALCLVHCSGTMLPTLWRLWALCLMIIPLGQAIPPSPTASFTRWCNSHYGQGSLQINVHQAEHIVLQPTLPVEGHPPHLNTLGGIWGPGTWHQLVDDPMPFVQQALNHIATVLQPELLNVAEVVWNQVHQQTLGPWAAWRVFVSPFNWQLVLGVCNNICMPYHKVKAMKASGISIRPDGYLSCYCGRTDDAHKSKDGFRDLPNVSVRMYAHRLVCYAFNGPPQPGQTVVSHTCNNPSCLNPRHLKWAAQQENMANSL